MTMERFYSDLIYREMILYTPADVVQYSFIVQKSISPLNLELCQSYIVWDGFTDSDFPSYTYSNDFITTEEKCRTILPESRSLYTLLYTLHLDLPRGREGNLKIESQSEDMNFHLANPHLAKIFIDDPFYPDIFYSFLDYACQSSDQHLRIFKWFINFDVLEISVYHQLPHHIINYITECMHPELEDLKFVRDCFKKLNLIDWLVNSDSSASDRVTNLLYQFHRIGRNVYVIWTDSVWTEEFIDFFLSISSFQLVGDVLKLKSAPSFTDDLHDFLIESILKIRESMILNRNAENRSRQRQTLLLQIIWVYLKQSENPSAASEFLYLIWNSVPDSFISPIEFVTAFDDELNPEEIDNIYNFYSEAVGGMEVFLEPRSLKHYCRTVIRRILHQRKHWLPEGVKETGLPKLLQSYVNLGREHLIDFSFGFKSRTTE